jgi:hypothetical protein
MRNNAGISGSDGLARLVSCPAARVALAGRTHPHPSPDKTPAHRSSGRPGWHKAGSSGAGIVAMLLPWVVGPKITKEIILLGQDRIPAARACEIGMVNRVVASNELEGVALAIANSIAAVDPNLVKETKRAINRAFEAQNMLEALKEGLAIDLAIEGAGCSRQIAWDFGSCGMAARSRPEKPASYKYALHSACLAI